MNNTSPDRPKPSPPPTRAEMFERERKRIENIQAVDLSAIRSPAYLQNRGLTSLLRSPLIESFPESTPSVTVCAVSKERDGDDSSSEDACAISQDGTRLVISDGVSQSSLPRPWAAMLVQKWVENPIFSSDPSQWQDWLDDPREAWKIWVAEEWIKHINEYRAKKGEPPRDKRSIEPAIKEVIAEGASATFLGVELDRQQQTVRALAIGDSCMFLLHSQSRRYDSFPLRDPSEFGNLPHQIGSSGGRAGRFEETLLTYSSGDILVLATDAISKWLMESLNSDFNSTLGVLEGLNSHNFRRFVEQAWDKGHIEHDDVTLMMVILGGANLRHVPPAVMPPLSARRPPRLVQ